YYGIRLRVDRPAKLVMRTSRYTKLLSYAGAHIGTVFPAPRRAGITCGDYLVIFYNNRPPVSPQAGPPFQNHFRNVEVVVVFISSAHIQHSLPGHFLTGLTYSHPFATPHAHLLLGESEMISYLRNIFM